MISQEDVTLTAPQQRYMDWLCTAPSERDPATKNAMANVLGVDVTTLRRWEKRPAFREAWKRQVDDFQRWRSVRRTLAI